MQLPTGLNETPHRNIQISASLLSLQAVQQNNNRSYRPTEPPHTGCSKQSTPLYDTQWSQQWISTEESSATVPTGCVACQLQFFILIILSVFTASSIIWYRKNILTVQHCLRMATITGRNMSQWINNYLYCCTNRKLNQLALNSRSVCCSCCPTSELRYIHPFSRHEPEATLGPNITTCPGVTATSSLSISWTHLGEWMYNSTYSYLGTRWKSVVSFMLRPLYPGYLLNVRSCRAQRMDGTYEEENNFAFAGKRTIRTIGWIHLHHYDGLKS